MSEEVTMTLNGEPQTIMPGQTAVTPMMTLEEYLQMEITITDPQGRIVHYKKPGETGTRTILRTSTGFLLGRNPLPEGASVENTPRERPSR